MKFPSINELSALLVPSSCEKIRDPGLGTSLFFESSLSILSATPYLVLKYVKDEIRKIIFWLLTQCEV